MVRHSRTLFWVVPLSCLNRILPKWVPIRPHRWWIHTRTVFAPMSYLYGVKFKAEENDLILALREVCAPYFPP